MNCTKCLKDDVAFTIRKSGKPFAWCKVCHAKHKKQKREQNLKSNNIRVQELRAVKRKERQSYIMNYLSKNPCRVCGEQDPIVLEFDHVDPSTKKYDVSTIVHNALSQETLEEEIKKCDVLCANCHARKTAKQFNTYKWALSSTD